MYRLLVLLFLVFTVCVNAKVTFESSLDGDFYKYTPSDKPKNILLGGYRMQINIDYY
jgi:hypothetical protein